MNLTQFDLKTVDGYQSWLEDKIRQLSVTALSSNTLTCHACGEIAGTYIIEYQGQTFRLPGEEALAFLEFITVN
ncbi:hypothetical protein C7293_20160 [filamentous cyanobacterium CCT1]|nr:hypothetical protein C7293_20160 [filamentous cyanobacterium CCT1]PSN79226.1 hypothetical protein C8B47_12795 [filamentous cyanobacterium CCP4]